MNEQRKSLTLREVDDGLSLDHHGGWTITEIDLSDNQPTGAAIESPSPPPVDSVELVPQHGSVPEPIERPDLAEPPLPPDSHRLRAQGVTVAEVVDAELLDRLLGMQEEKANANARLREMERVLSATSSNQELTVRQLVEERREREWMADRLREERSARLVADAKLTELKERMEREKALAAAEKQARAVENNLRLWAEREAATALASMGWLARRRYVRAAQDVRDRLQ